MAIDTEAYLRIKNECDAKGVTLVAVSKTKPHEDIMALYELGQRDFGENYVQELIGKQEALPKDIRWHFIGHLQTNKVKYIASFVHLIHGVDSQKLLKEIDKQAEKHLRHIGCLLQMHIAREETKFGMDESELEQALLQQHIHVQVTGLMGMASFSNDMVLVRNEFKYLSAVFGKYHNSHPLMQTLSMGMSSDYTIAIEEGSNMVRIGSLLFGAREKKN